MGERTIQQLVDELATMGLVETWTESKGRSGRAMYVETTFDLEGVYEVQAEVSGALVSTDDE
ncbi:hypothetical protein [Halalkalicoccus salilacus]|uniref:hypothetical protein n=1 Tax=Halalkalicoccus salilacus TaxID=3117459 RepID=UPI00300F363D